MMGTDLPFDAKAICNPFIPEGPYRDGLIEAILSVWPFLSSSEKEDLVDKKLRLFDANPDQAQYLQAACELTVCSFFARYHPDSFKYEYKANPPKDVDCAFSDPDRVRYLIEVKCADYSRQREIAQTSDFRISAFGRLDGFFELQEKLQDLFASGSEPHVLKALQHMDNKLKDYLESAHQKFPDSSEEPHVNVLVVCCDDQMDMLRWQGYLYGPLGLFTADSFADAQKYQRVGAVIFTNLFHRHECVDAKDKLSCHWMLEHAFSCIHQNPYTCIKGSLIAAVQRFFPNLNDELISHLEGLSDLDKPLALSIFVAEKQFAREEYRFQPVINV